MPESIEQVLNKIKKLLALTQSPNENEAAVAAAKAQELMMQYKISMAEVVKFGKVDDTPIQQESVLMDFAKTEGQWQIYLINNVAQWNFCTAITSRDALGNLIVYVIGKPEDIAFVKELNAWLQEQIYGAARVAWRNYYGPERKNTFKRGFYMGATGVVGRRLKEQRESMERQLGEQVTAIIVRSDAMIQDFMAVHYPYLSMGRQSHVTGAHGYQAGRQAAQQMDISSRGHKLEGG